MSLQPSKIMCPLTRLLHIDPHHILHQDPQDFAHSSVSLEASLYVHPALQSGLKAIASSFHPGWPHIPSSAGNRGSSLVLHTLVPAVGAPAPTSAPQMHSTGTLFVSVIPPLTHFLLLTPSHSHLLVVPGAHVCLHGPPVLKQQY